MDKVDDQSPIQKTKISFSEELSKLEKGDDISQQQQEEADPESMADWEQRTPYTTMQVDTSYLNKSGSASSKLNRPVFVALMVISIALVWVLMSLPSLCHFEVICSRHASPQVSDSMSRDFSREIIAL